MSTEFRSVLDDRSSRLISRVYADKITRNRSRSRGGDDDDDDCEVIVSRVEQPYRTSSSAVTTPFRMKKSERTRSISPAPPARKTKKGKGKKKRKSGSKHVTYDEKVTVRHSDTEESVMTDLSGRGSRGSSRMSSMEFLQHKNSPHIGDHGDPSYADQIRATSHKMSQNNAVRSAPDGAQISPRSSAVQYHPSRASPRQSSIQETAEFSEISPQDNTSNKDSFVNGSSHRDHSDGGIVVTKRPPTGRSVLPDANVTSDITSSPGKGDSGFCTENEQSRSRINIKKDYVYDRTISYRAAIQAQYSDEVRRLAEENIQEMLPPGCSPRTGQSNVQSNDVHSERSNTMQSQGGDNKLSGSRRSVSSSISNFFKKMSPSLPRRKRRTSYNGSAQSLDSGSFHSEVSENAFAPGQRARMSLNRLLGRGRSKSNDPAVMAEHVNSRNERTSESRSHDTTDSADQRTRQNFPNETNRILKSIEQNSTADKSMYQKYKDKPVPPPKPLKLQPVRVSTNLQDTKNDVSVNSHPPANKANRNMTFNESSLIASTPFRDDSNKVRPPKSLNVRPMMRTKPHTLQSSLLSTGSGDESIGECSLDVNLDGGTDAELLLPNHTQTSLSRQVILSKDNLNDSPLRSHDNSNQSESGYKTFNQSDSTHNPHNQSETGSKTLNQSDPSGYKPVKTTDSRDRQHKMSAILDHVDYTESEFASSRSHIPTYLKVSCAVSGYGRYSTYSSYNVDKRSVSSPSLSFRSVASMNLSRDNLVQRRTSHAANTSPQTMSPQPAAEAPRLCLQNGVTEKARYTRFPTGNAEQDGDYFLNMAKVEEDRLCVQCQKAERDITSNIVPEDACGKMRAAIGKTQLLITRKLRQFSELCEKHKCPNTSGPMTTWEDLQGFWDMVHIQIDDVDDHFREIEIMRQNDWAEIPPLSMSNVSSASSSPQSASMSSHSTTPSHTPKHTPSSKRRGLKPNSSCDSLTDQSSKAKALAKTRDIARKKMIAEKRANMKSSKTSLDSDVMIYLPDNNNVADDDQSQSINKSENPSQESRKAENSRYQEGIDGTLI